MASPATSSHLPALAEPHARQTIAHELESTMHELVDLSLIGKQLHWAVVGHAFRPVHEQLDELVASWRDLADVVAERAVALGYVPDGQARAVAAGSPLSPVAAEATESPRRGTQRSRLSPGPCSFIATTVRSPACNAFSS
jgi:starvation-inducible DNA-binding protein